MNAAQVVYEPLMYLNCIYELFLLSNLLEGFLPDYEDRRGLKIAKTIGCATVMYVVNIFKMPFLNLIFVPIIFLVFSWLMYRVELKYNFLYVTFYYVIMAVSEFIFFYVYTLLEVDVTKAGFGRVILLIIKAVFTFTVVQIIKKSHQISYKSDSYQYLKSLFILPIASMILLNGFFVQVKYPINHFMICVGGIMLMISIIVDFSVIEKLLKAVNSARDAEMLIMKSKLEKNHYERLEEVNLGYAKHIHELDHIVRVMKQLAHTQDNNAVEALASEVLEKGFSPKAKTYIGDSIINAIFIEREKMAIEMGVKYSVNVQLGIDLGFIKNIDKISMFGNLLDNALEAAQANENGFVTVNLFMGNETIVVFEIQNNFKIKPKKKGREFLTIKQEKLKHGFGIKNVEELAQNYAGMLGLCEEENTFTATLILSNVQKMES